MLGLLKVKSVHERIWLKQKQAFVSRLRMLGITGAYEQSMHVCEKERDSYLHLSNEMADSLEQVQARWYHPLQNYLSGSNHSTRKAKKHSATEFIRSMCRPFMRNMLFALHKIMEESVSRRTARLDGLVRIVQNRLVKHLGDFRLGCDVMAEDNRAEAVCLLVQR